MKPSAFTSAVIPSRPWRKVTYSIPATVADELDRRTQGRGRVKSRVVSEALARYFADQDREALQDLYAQAAADPLFVADNKAVETDFAALDAEVDERRP